MNWNSPEMKNLLNAFLLLENEKEAAKFLRDIMTISEIEEFARRLRAAEMLSQKVPYTTIVRETGLSSTTVARVAKWLNGKEGGYRLILEKLHHHNTSKPTQVGGGLS